jgi:hypothetical protein
MRGCGFSLVGLVEMSLALAWALAFASASTFTEHE